MKRFTATEKWAKPWFQGLPPNLKCLWLYICDNTDAAGVWEPNFKLASFQIGGKAVSEADMAQFGDRVVKLDNGKFAIVSFVQFQYGTLSKDCKAHIPVFRALEKNSLSKGYPKAMHSLQEEDKDKEEETVQEKEGGSAEVGFPEVNRFEGLPKALDSPLFREAWTEYVDYRKERHLPKLLRRSVSERWKECEIWGVEASVNSIRQAIANGWQGIFSPKANDKTHRHGTLPEQDMPKVIRYG